MAYCGRCGREVNREAWFCPFCGAPATTFLSLPASSIEVENAIKQGFSIEEMLMEHGRPVFYVRPYFDIKHSFSVVKNRLAQIGYTPFLRKRANRLVMLIVSQPRIKPSSWIWNLLLFLATIATTIFVGYQLSMPLVNEGLMPNPWQGALSFSAAVIGILGCHELGHKFMAGRRGVAATLPYFIPVPFFIGTMGAVIQTKEPTPNRDALFDLGAAGPIAGFIVLVPVAILGLYWSYQVPVEAIPPKTIGLPVPLLFNLLFPFINIQAPRFAILFHPVAFASWVGALVTMLNLMPVGMLDGGHVARAIFGERWHRVISLIAAATTFALGWWYMALFMFFLSLRPHIGPLDDASPLMASRKIVAIGLCVLLFLCAVPGWMTGF